MNVTRSTCPLIQVTDVKSRTSKVLEVRGGEILSDETIRNYKESGPLDHVPELCHESQFGEFQERSMERERNLEEYQRCL